MKKLLVTPLLYYFRFWAKLALRLYKPTVVGITGSVGKSSARNAIYSMLKDYFPTKVVSKGNSEIGLPLGIVGIEVKSLGFQTPLRSILDYLKLILLSPIGALSYLSGVKYLVVEMGIDSPYPPQNMQYLLTIVKPDIAVFLNVHPTHTQEFDSLISSEIVGDERLEKVVQTIADEKGRIITESGCKLGIVNADNIFIENVLKKNKVKKIQFFGKKIENDISYLKHKVSLTGTAFTFRYKKEEVEVNFSSFVLPEEYQEVIAATILVGAAAGLSLSQIKLALEENFSLPPGRASIFQGIHDSILIDSSYNASKVAVLAFLNLVQDLKDSDSRPAAVLLGDMRELGKEAKMEHEEVAERLVDFAEYVYLVGELTKQYVLPLVEKEKHVKEFRWFGSSQEAGKYLTQHLQKNSLLLIKGSQNTIYLEEAVKLLLSNKNDESKLCRQSSYWLKTKGVM